MTFLRYIHFDITLLQYYILILNWYFLREKHEENRRPFFENFLCVYLILFTWLIIFLLLMSFCLPLYVYTKYFFPWRNINPYFKKFEDDLLNEKEASVKC